MATSKKEKEIGLTLITIGIIILSAAGVVTAYSLRVDEIESAEVLAAILGAIVLNSGVFVFLKDCFTMPVDIGNS